MKMDSYPSRIIIPFLGVLDELLNLILNILSPFKRPFYYSQMSMSFMVYMQEKRVRRELRALEILRKEREQQYEQLKKEALDLLDNGKDL